MSAIGEHWFLVVRHDRHTDDHITVHESETGARLAVAEFKACYPEDTVWLSSACPHWPTSEYVDDGPRVHIEITELRS